MTRALGAALLVSLGCGTPPAAEEPKSKGPATWQEALPAGADMVLYLAPRSLADHPSLSLSRALVHLGTDTRQLVTTLDACGLPVSAMRDVAVARYDGHFLAAIRAPEAGRRAEDCARRYAEIDHKEVVNVGENILGVRGEATRLWSASDSLLVIATHPDELAAAQDASLPRLADQPGVLAPGVRAGDSSTVWFAAAGEVLGAFPGSLVQNADLQLTVVGQTLRVRVQLAGADPAAGQALEAWALMTLRDAAPALRKRGFAFIADRTAVARSDRRVELSIDLSPEEVKSLLEPPDAVAP